MEDRVKVQEATGCDSPHSDGLPYREYVSLSLCDEQRGTKRAALVFVLEKLSDAIEAIDSGNLLRAGIYIGEVRQDIASSILRMDKEARAKAQ